MLKLVLSAGGHDVAGIVDSLDLYRTLDTFQPDVLVMDLWMPVLNGDEALQALRAADQYRNLPVVMMSASPDGKSVARRAGATQFIAKPFDIGHMRSIVMNCVA